MFLGFIKKLWKIFRPYWMKFAHVVGEVNQSILLGVLYFLVIGIYSLFLKIINILKYFLGKKPTTMWQDFTENQDNLEALEKSF